MTPRDQALLDYWQSNRHLPPAQRLPNESDGAWAGQSSLAADDTTTHADSKSGSRRGGPLDINTERT